MTLSDHGRWLQPLGYRTLRAGFGNDFRGTGHTGNRRTPCDNGEGFRFIFRESAHPLVENGTQFVIVEAVVMEVFVGQFTQRLNGGNILRQVTDPP